MRLLRKEIRIVLATPRPNVVAGQNSVNNRWFSILAAQRLVLLAGCVHDCEIDDAALLVELQIHHRIPVGESNRRGVLQHRLGGQHGRNVTRPD